MKVHQISRSELVCHFAIYDETKNALGTTNGYPAICKFTVYKNIPMTLQFNNDTIISILELKLICRLAEKTKKSCKF